MPHQWPKSLLAARGVSENRRREIEEISTACLRIVESSWKIGRSERQWRAWSAASFDDGATPASTTVRAAELVDSAASSAERFAVMSRRAHRPDMKRRFRRCAVIALNGNKPTMRRARHSTRRLKTRRAPKRIRAVADLGRCVWQMAQK
jgi:hypothetical protein